jgi:predicted nucleotide-binding protein
MQNVAVRIGEFADDGWKTTSSSEHSKWGNRVFAFLSSAVDETTATKFKELGVGALLEDWKDCRDRQAGHLEGLALRIGATDLAKEESKQQGTVPITPIHLSKKVFVVHGHDVEAKETVARFIERLRLDPVILHEQPNSGRTIIEKFEVFSDVGFAVILLTPDDVGASSGEPKNLKPRARQNVILELGYFMGKLSRFRVCALFKKGVEIPSDYQGVLYIELDPAGAWKKNLAQELVEANFSIDLDGLLHG